MTETILENEWVRLEPIQPSHEPEFRALEVDSRLWQYSMLDVGPFEHWVRAWFEAILQPSSDLPFAVRRKTDSRVVGSTRFLNRAPTHHRVEIGGTFYEASARGSAVNPACKRLLFTHAFEELGCGRVELKCDDRNEHSKRAMRKLGASFEGTLRQHMIYESGYVRDTTYFSVLKHEWPDVRARLEQRLQAFA